MLIVQFVSLLGIAFGHNIVDVCFAYTLKKTDIRQYTRSGELLHLKVSLLDISLSLCSIFRCENVVDTRGL